jgi:hypothetical protein
LKPLNFKNFLNIELLFHNTIGIIHPINVVFYSIANNPSINNTSKSKLV